MTHAASDSPGARPAAVAAQDWLTRIVAHTRAELALGRAAGEALSPGAARRATPARPFAQALRGAQLTLIAEYKPRSPSAAVLAGPVAPEAFAAAVGPVAAAVSVLIDGPFFGGSLQLLRQIRALVPQPVLAKGFVVDVRQLDQLAAAGADAVLLIAEALPGPQLQQLVDAAHERGLQVLVEAHSPEQATRIVQTSADAVGINARSLSDLSINLPAALALLDRLQTRAVKVAESGVTTPDDVALVRAQQQRGGVDAVLMGTGLYRSTAQQPPDVVAAVHQLGFVRLPPSHLP